MHIFYHSCFKRKTCVFLRLSDRSPFAINCVSINKHSWWIFFPLILLLMPNAKEFVYFSKFQLWMTWIFCAWHNFNFEQLLSSTYSLSIACQLINFSDETSFSNYYSCQTQCKFQLKMAKKNWDIIQFGSVTTQR